MSQKLALVLSLALSAAAHDVHKVQRAPSPTIQARGPPYPTGPGYDVVPLASIVPLSPGQPPVLSIFPYADSYILSQSIP